jgi:type I restriction enzyme, S subunit
MSNELQPGWAHCSVGKAFRSFGGGTPNRSTSAYWKGSIPWLSSGDIKTERIHSASEFITRTGLENSSSSLCRPGSVLVVVRSGVLKHTLPVAVLECEAAINQDIKCFDSGCSELNEWLSLALRASANDILALNREGTTVQSVKYETLKEFDLAIPPPVEQKRILAKVGKLLGQVETCQQRLARIPALLKRFRQAILAAACSGRLTADWREGNHRIQTATELLRAFQVEQKTTKKRAGRLWGAGEVPQLTDEELEGLPSTWVWTKVGALGYDSADAVQVGPMSMQSRDFTEKGVPVLNVGCVQLNGFDESKLDHMPTEKADTFSRYKIAADDILFTRSGTVGRCALATSRQDGWLMTFHLLRVRPNPGKCLPKYLLFVLQGSSNVLRQTTGAAIGSTRAGFNTRLLAELDVPLPPFGEQQEIVHRVESLFALVDRLEARFAGAQKRVNSITQAILAKAFRGELVPTEFELAKAEGRSFESAEELLERIGRNGRRSELKKATINPTRRKVVHTNSKKTK